MNILERVKALHLPDGEYAVIGSGILAAKKIREAKDIDLVVTEKLLNELRARGWKRIWFFRGMLYRKLIRSGDAEAFSNVHYKKYNHSAEEIIRGAEHIDGIPFMSLGELIEFKKALGREKDIRDIQLIEEYLKTHPR